MRETQAVYGVISLAKTNLGRLRFSFNLAYLCLLLWFKHGKQYWYYQVNEVYVNMGNKILQYERKYRSLKHKDFSSMLNICSPDKWDHVGNWAETCYKIFYLKHKLCLCIKPLCLKDLFATKLSVDVLVTLVKAREVRAHVSQKGCFKTTLCQDI